MKQNSLGLQAAESSRVAADLNELLANFQVYYQNLRGLHWNIRGKRFFDLHLKFEELYNDAQLKIDEIAERILTLGATPLHTFESYSSKATVPVGESISEDEKAVRLILRSLAELLRIERTILKKAAEMGDEGTNTLMSDYIREQEKTIWMMKAWLEEDI